jgi:hypothetical protein
MNSNIYYNPNGYDVYPNVYNQPTGFNPASSDLAGDRGKLESNLVGGRRKRSKPSRKIKKGRKANKTRKNKSKK